LPQAVTPSLSVLSISNLSEIKSPAELALEKNINNHFDELAKYYYCRDNQKWKNQITDSNFRQWKCIAGGTNCVMLKL
jgi:hypothetical protein